GGLQLLWHLRAAEDRRPRDVASRQQAGGSPGYGSYAARRGSLHERRRRDPRAAGRRRRAESGSRGGESMKLIVAIVRPDKVNDVLEALYRVKVRGLSLSRVQGHGGELERVETYRGTTVKVDLNEQVRFEIGVSDHFVDRTVRAIMAAALTDEVGDGKIFVLPVERVYRIRTGEEDTA